MEEPRQEQTEERRGGGPPATGGGVRPPPARSPHAPGRGGRDGVASVGSTTILVIAGLIGVIGVAERVHGAAAELSGLLWGTPQALFELKVFLLTAPRSDAASVLAITKTAPPAP
jgi:hypothetical protein